MTFGISVWLQQFWGMQRLLLRKVATAQGLAFIHIEILMYLGGCNRYSNTMLAVADYLGQTKGSVSQSLAWLERRAFIRREADQNDKRVMRLNLTAKGRIVLKKIDDLMPRPDGATEKIEDEFRRMLTLWRTQAGLAGFGVCRTCRFNECHGDGKYRCGLTGEMLLENEVRQICREHAVAA